MLVRTMVALILPLLGPMSTAAFQTDQVWVAETPGTHGKLMFCRIVSSFIKAVCHSKPIVYGDLQSRLHLLNAVHHDTPSPWHPPSLLLENRIGLC